MFRFSVTLSSEIAVEAASGDRWRHADSWLYRRLKQRPRNIWRHWRDEWCLSRRLQIRASASRAKEPQRSKSAWWSPLKRDNPGQPNTAAPMFSGLFRLGEQPETTPVRYRLSVICQSPRGLTVVYYPRVTTAAHIEGVVAT